MNYSQQKRINDNTCSESKFQKKEGKMQVQSNKNGKEWECHRSDNCSLFFKVDTEKFGKRYHHFNSSSHSTAFLFIFFGWI
ncbi:hypothetical protein JHK82_054265 [Glycine max]|nr:hypothetical protein JHK86_054112 [Glycine max]KAG4928584.1 hypothetical protein JHK85_055070 [Glycine max]KAG5084097.1 hypothetical protein JHK84_054135 [Glycine max]KAG5086868.1 hypothetical protein JHK82_054265 [Glycine max]